jgi:putative nucleotidyltransferase with HDIG domain
MMKRADVLGRIERVTSLPTLPDIVTRIIKMVDSPETTASTIGSEISKDQVLSAKVLKLVNSGFYGFSQPIKTISHAMVLLGFNVVKSLVLSATVFDMMAQAVHGLWEHSLACAVGAGVIAKKLDLTDPEEVSVSGLLHDLGKVVEAEYFRQEFVQITKLIEEEDLLFYQAEERIIGLHHATIGEWLLEQWKLPRPLIDPIAYHHNFHPSRENADRTAVVHIADVLVKAKGYGYSGDSRVPILDPAALNHLQLSIDDLKTIMEMIDEDVAKVQW